MHDDEFQVDPVHGARYRFEPLEGGDLRVETVIEPGGALPKHHHPSQDETWWVERGEVRLFLDGRWRDVTPADGRIEVPSGVVHALKNESSSDVHLGAEARPALDLEAFLTESAAAAREGLFRRGGIPTGWRGAKWAAAFIERYSDQVILSFPPRPLQKAMRPLARLKG